MERGAGVWGGIALMCFLFVTVAAEVPSELIAADQALVTGEKTYGPPAYSPPYSPSPTYSPSPVTPAVGPAPYSSPVVPSVGPITSPYTPSAPAPTSSPGSCSWWSSNTSSFPSFITILTTLIDLLGGTSGISSIFGSNITLYQGLTNTRPDAYGALLRQGSAAILNSYTNRNYPYTPFQVKSSFRGALVSQQAASVMAAHFENANNGYGRRQ